MGPGNLLVPSVPNRPYQCVPPVSLAPPLPGKNYARIFHEDNLRAIAHIIRNRTPVGLAAPL